nr:DUF2970 domain-containing protein [Crenobacter caeni]
MRAVLAAFFGVRRGRAAGADRALKGWEVVVAALLVALLAAVLLWGLVRGVVAAAGG